MSRSLLLEKSNGINFIGPMPATESKAHPKPRGGRREGAGRKSKRHAAIEEVLLEAVELGMSIPKACALAGIHPATYADWCERDSELEPKIEAARGRGIRRALKQLEALKTKGDGQSIRWWLEKMDREMYGAQPAALVAANQQNNFYGRANGHDTAEADQMVKFIEANRTRMALARELRENGDPDKAREIESYTIDLDGDAAALDRDDVEEAPHSYG